MEVLNRSGFFICKKCHWLQSTRGIPPIGWTGNQDDTGHLGTIYEFVRYGICEHCNSVHHFTAPQWLQTDLPRDVLSLMLIKHDVQTDFLSLVEIKDALKKVITDLSMAELKSLDP